MRAEVTGAAAHAGQDLRHRKRIAYGLVPVEAVCPLNGKFDKLLVGNRGGNIRAFRSNRYRIRFHGDGLGICAYFQYGVDADCLRHFDPVLQGREPFKSRGLDANIPRPNGYLRQGEISRRGRNRLHDVMGGSVFRALLWHPR